MRKCAVCRKEFESYVPIERKYVDTPKKFGRTYEVRSELLNKEEYSCPYCYSADRDRMIVMLVDMLHQKLEKGINFLEIAPSGALQRYLYRYWGKSNLYTADLYMDEVDYKVDIQNMDILRDGSFDFIICSHVLEHVKDDRQAMREINRVLANDGLGIIIVPLDLNRSSTDEAWGLSEEENIRRFGQKDHVRSYSKNDYVMRLEQSGFGVWQLDKSFFSAKSFEENALLDSSTLYLVYKNKEQYKKREEVIERFKESHQNVENLEWKAPQGKCNYWIDVCDIHENMLRIWGWVYIDGADSKISKLKIMLKNEAKEYIFGHNYRKREDIQESFGDSSNNYLFSGIDFLLPVSEIEKGSYSVYILVMNGKARYIIEAASNLEL